MSLPKTRIGEVTSLIEIKRLATMLQPVFVRARWKWMGKYPPIDVIEQKILDCRRYSGYTGKIGESAGLRVVREATPPVSDVKQPSWKYWLELHKGLADHLPEGWDKVA